MNEKLKLWNTHSTWEAAEAAWDQSSQRAAKDHPLKVLSHLPDMPGITKDTARGLKWKSLKYILQHDAHRVLPRYFFKHPLKYAWNFVTSLLRNKSYHRDGDFFFYGCSGLAEFSSALEDPNTLLIAGFSYCHKPLECPSGRFNDQCIHDLTNPVCQQCFIGKMRHALPDTNVIPLLIPTIHYIGEKIFEIVEKHPNRKILFLITACEMTLEMFGDWGNMVAIQGIGVRLDGRICNTMKAFELSEKGIKPGLTVVLEPTQKRMLELIKALHKNR